MNDPARYYRFDGYVMDVLLRVVHDPSGARVALTSKAFEVLRVLIERRDEVVSRSDLIAAAWPGRIIEENTLNQAIATLRRSFGVDHRSHRHILTVPGQGYRFVGELGAGRGPRPVQATLLVPSLRLLGAGGDDELLGLGMAESLVTRLSRSPALRVHSPNPHVEDDDTALERGRKAGVDHVLDGSVQVLGHTIRINARLLETAGGAVEWADTLDGDLDSRFDLQDQIADGVLRTLGLPLPPARPRDSELRPDMATYREWLRGHYLLQRPTALNLDKALTAFQRALSHDSAYTRAYSGMALVYRGMAHVDRDPCEVFPLARAAAQQALLLDPDCPEGLMALGRVEHLHAWDWDAAETLYQRALSINPSLVEARQAYAHLLIDVGRFKEGLSESRQALELDPLSPMLNALHGGFLTAAGESEAARRSIALALELQPGFWIALLIRAGMALDAGDADAAVTDAEAAATASDNGTPALAMLALAHAAGGRVDAARAILATLHSRAKQRYVPATGLAAVHLAMNDHPAALQQLEAAWSARDIRMVFLGIDARWRPLHADPGFQSLLRRMRLPVTASRSRL